MLNFFSGSQSPVEILMNIFILLMIVFVAFPFHECAHAFMAKRLGDTTAEQAGRLTLNPFAHIDLMGALAMFLFGIGWAKPVPVDVYKCKKVKPKMAMAITAIAGPLSNILLSLVVLIIYKVLFYTVMINSNDTSMYYLQYALEAIISINLYLAVFNLIPIPPFDGSRLFLSFLPERIYFKIMKYERFIMFGLLILLWTGILSLPLSIASDWLFSGLNWVTGFIDMIFSGGIA